MSNRNEKLIPELRFPEFEGEWGEVAIADVTSFIKDGTHGSHKDTVNGEYYLLSAKNIENGKINVNEDDRRISKEEYEKITSNYELQKGDILLSIVGTIGRTAIYKGQEKIAFQRSVAFFRFPKGEPYFIFNLMNAPGYQRELLRRQVVSAQPGIYLGELAKIQIHIPSPQEQQKIASFLSLIDKKIELLKKKKELLELYKKGVMQKVFNREIRFKDNNGNDYPEWEEKRLGEIAQVNKGEQKNRSELREKFEYPVINGGQEPSGFLDTFNTPKNTITISEGGNSCGFVNFITKNFWSGGHCYTLEDLKKSINLYYLYNYLKFNENSIMRLRVGSGLPNIQMHDINKLKILLPSIQEQLNIRNLFNVIKGITENNVFILEKTKLFKRGLLQKMFL